MINYRALILLSLCLMVSGLSAQTDSLEYNGAFKRGKWFTGLNGSFSSGIIEFGTVSSDNNEFFINIKNGKFLRDRMLLGLNFQLGKSGTDNDQVVNSTDQFSVGPFFRYYLSKDPRAGIYPEISLQYARVRIDREIAGTQVSTLSLGNGISFESGVGFTYAITDAVGFDLTLLYRFTRVEADTEDRVNQSTINETIEFNDVVFAFGFVVMLEEFFF